MNSLEVIPHPLLSVILIVRNEADHIEASLSSVASQETANFDMEILVVDGASVDGTQQIARKFAAADSRITLVVNEREKTPAAMNLGLREAKGEYVCIMGAHAHYAKNYISVCLDELRRTGAAGCSGMVLTRPLNNTVEAKLIALALEDPFGSSTGSCRTQSEGFVDSISYPVFVKQALLDVGGYDEQLHRNQDNDMNQRLRARGHHLYLTSKTHCEYFVKGTFRSLAQYALNTGFWNFISFRRNRSSMSLRHFTPFLFVLALAGTMMCAVVAPFAPAVYQRPLLAPAVLLLGSYLVAGSLASARIAIRKRWLSALLLPPVFFLFHFCYGIGTFLAVIRNARCEETVPDPRRYGQAPA